ncbi:diphthine--ammonia ligase [Aquimarina sp. 2201CG14-23]|uniref:Dph6-related ATP pyrophosphatase n=1 Tax=Aquimarina mycalae TaxID=3040073 RepID=UPI002477DB34|nr:diphthine--ammonia ligase [Aquimarina sp. 2201CG14-23]MDH7444095.1 diphthine--ammonia ligase [Aquimarina sp. 2201CG14-23]
MSFVCSWSGGKDSCYAMHKAIEKGNTASVLFNVLNEYGDRSRSHGIPKEILEAQARSLHLPIHFFESTWNDYERLYIDNLKSLTDTYKLESAVFGDIDIVSHRQWEEKVSGAANLKAILPIWQQPRKQLVLDMIDFGVEAMIVSCNKDLGPNFLGRIIDKELIKELETLSVDVCGENGEYHTLVTNAPLFKEKLQVKVVDKEISSNYNFAKLVLD